MKIKKPAAVAVGAGIGAALGKSIKDKKFCPLCAAKKAYSSLFLHTPAGERYENSTALTPPMGWSSWNTFRNTIDENLIKSTAEAMKKSGLLDAGYRLRVSRTALSRLLKSLTAKALKSVFTLQTAL